MPGCCREEETETLNTYMLTNRPALYEKNETSICVTNTQLREWSTAAVGRICLWTRALFRFLWLFPLLSAYIVYQRV